MVATSVAKEATKTDTYAEWDTQETIDAVCTALEERHRVTLIEANEEAYQRLREIQPEIVFNIAEGFRGASREAQIPAILEMLGIPYTGSDPSPSVSVSISPGPKRSSLIIVFPILPFMLLRPSTS